MTKTAIIIDGAFYCKRARVLMGDVAPRERAKEIQQYCNRHMRNDKDSELYRVLFYDCPPSTKKVYHPLLGKDVDLGKSPIFKWTSELHQEIILLRKFALRLGVLSDEHAVYRIKPMVERKIVAGKMTLDALTSNDFELSIAQKGVDMRIGLDIASMSLKKQVDRIILISGDSDFVPAAKLARREGIDFILDPMWHPIKHDLCEHIDGLRTMAPKPHTPCQNA